MDIVGFEKIAKYLAVPLVLVGFGLMLAFGIHSKLIDSGLLTQVSPEESGAIIRLMLGYGFQLGLCVTVLGFGLAAWSKYMDKVQPVDAGKVAKELLAGQLEIKDEQIKALTEAVTALTKTDAPFANINAALQALEQGNTAQAQAIFAEVAATKETAGKKNNQEAAEAYRHLGALAYMNNPKEALTAYQKAVELDPDNADG
jgi:tetratricopeptide (TPR) repeat protein